MKTLTEVLNTYDKLNEPELTAFESDLLHNFSKGKLNTEVKNWFEDIMIHKYIDNEWDENNKKIAGKLINSDNNLLTKYRTYQSVSDVLTKTETGRENNLTDNDFSELKKEKKYSVSLFRKITSAPLSIAAVITILIVIGSIFYFFTGNYSDEKLYASFYTPYDIDFNISRDKPDELLVKAQTAYINKDYKLSSEILQGLTKNDSTNIQMFMNLGALMMQQNKYDEASAYFNYVIEHNTFIMRDIAEWYLALCYLKTGEREKAWKIFTNITESNSVMKAQAERLLKKMK
jgi:tetratricopeptide (TPR) repeat protein